MTADAHEWRLSAFCLFVGYARSGHSAVGSLIDAHPNAVISHELNAVKRYAEGVSRDQLFSEIFTLSQQQALAGRASSKADGGAYQHVIQGQLKPDSSNVLVLGDKKGAGTTVQLAQRGLGFIDEFRQFIGVPVKMLHVIRNPFDIIAAERALGRNAFQRLLPAVALIRQREQSADWLDVYYEDLLANPAAEIKRITSFLGIAADHQHTAVCEDYLYKTPSRRGSHVTWSTDDLALISRLIREHPFLERYAAAAQPPSPHQV